MNNHKSSREKMKMLKNWLICAKHVIFVIGLNREQVARASRQNTQDKNFQKIF